MQKISKIFRTLAFVIAIHGVLFALYSLIVSIIGSLPNKLEACFFWIFAGPALLLEYPLDKLLWKLGLITGDWWAWPTPLGFILVYTIWILGLWGLWWISKKYMRRKNLLPR